MSAPRGRRINQCLSSSGEANIWFRRTDSIKRSASEVIREVQTWAECTFIFFFLTRLTIVCIFIMQTNLILLILLYYKVFRIWVTKMYGMYRWTFTVHQTETLPAFLHSFLNPLDPSARELKVFGQGTKTGSVNRQNVDIQVSQSWLLLLVLTLVKRYQPVCCCVLLKS